jgi:adenine-specific DNA-methyltransferase
MQEEINKNNDITANSKQLETLKTHFPQCFDKDGRFRPNKLEDIVRASGGDITREGYKLDWLGKSYARLLANLKTETLLSPNTEHNALPQNANSENLLIQGDNLDVLKHLVNAYSEKVKMIYIDPPYNTGSDGFVYNDTRKFTVDELQRLAGVEEDEAKRILDFTNSSSNSHSAWLTFMYPRLYVARELLREDGVIFISIDDNEQAQLKLLCDEVFGEENFVASFLWEKRTNRENRKQVSTRHDIIMTYRATNDGQKVIRQLPMSPKALANYKNPDDDPRGEWKSDPATAQAGHGTPTQFYELVAPNGKTHQLESGRCWLFTKEVMEGEIAQGKIWFGKTGNGVPRVKTYLNSKERGLTPETIIFADEASTTEISKNLLKDLFNGKAVFETPKPVQLISILTMMCANDDSLLLDFFSGSGTTAHAVMALNAQDGGNRKHISVQLDEPTAEKSEARKAGYNTIFEITRERVKRAAVKIKEEHPDATCDFGFKEFKTIPANEGQFKGYLDDAATMQDYVPFNGMALDDDGIEALLTTWAAYDGLPLHEMLQEVDLGGYTAYMGGDKLYFVNRGLGIEHITAMLTRIDDDAIFTPRKIVVFHYMFNDKQLREFSEAVNAPNRKHLQLDFIQRF